jgi:hypothetical protein
LGGSYPRQISAIEMPFLDAEERAVPRKVSAQKQLRVGISTVECQRVGQAKCSVCCRKLAFVPLGERLEEPSIFTVDADENFSVPFLTPGDYDRTVSVPPGLLRMIGAKRNIGRNGSSADSRIRSFSIMSRLSARRWF